ncbi:hypothetical protein TB1_029420 [Malus domestica]
MHMHCLDPLLIVCADSDGALRIVDRCSRGGVAARNEGQGIADVLYGDSGFTGKLARTWLKRKFSQTNMVSDGRSKVISLINICGVVKCVVIVIPGHPVVVEQLISSADALVAAWPPELK